MNFLRSSVASFLSQWILPPPNDPSAPSSSAPLSLHLQSTSFQLVLELPTPLHIDCAAVNRSPIMSSSPILLHRFLVRQVKITASLFRRAGLRVEIHGLTVVFRPRPSGDGFWSTREENSNKEKKRKAIFELDPQGAAVHMASENYMKDRSTSSFLGTLIVSLLLRMLEVDVQNASIELHSNAVDSHSHHSCVVSGSLSTQEGSSLVGAVGERLVAISRSTKRPVGRIISIKDLGLKLATVDERESTSVAQGMCSQDATNSQRECRGFILLWKTVAVSIEFQNGHLTGVDAIFAETMVQMDVIKLQAFLVVARDFQGLPRVANPVPCLSSSQEIKGNGRGLWQKAMQKITSGSLRRFNGVMQTGKLRYKYTHLYVAWIIETSVGHAGKLNELSHLKNLKRKKEHVKILEEDLLHMERELPVEVIVLARYMARHKVEEIVKDKFTLLPRKCEKALIWLFAFWGAVKITFESVARYLKKSFARLYFYFKRSLMYVGCLWVMQKFIQWLSSLGCRFLGKYFGRINGSHKTDEASKKTWTRLRNRRGISLFTSSFPTGSVTLLGSPQQLALQNNDENFIEETERGIHFTWANFAVAYTFSPSKMGLQIVCEHIQGVFFDSPVDREEIIGFSNGQISGVKFLSSNPAPGISTPENVKNDFKHGDPLLAGSTFESEAEERYPSMLLEPNIGSNMNPFLLVCFEASHSISITTISEEDFIKCRLTMGCLECMLDYRSVAQLETVFSQYVGELIVDGQSSEHGLHESATFSSRRISEDFYARTMQFMSAIMIRRSIWLSAAVSGPKINFVLPILESETTYADLSHGSKLGRPALIISWEVFAATIWPPKVENNRHEQKKAAIRKTWLRSLPKPCITMEKFTTSHSEHLQIGSNGIFSLQGATLVLEDCNDMAMSQIVGPIHISGEFSLCRDHFISSAGAKDIMSASAMIVISSIPITMQLDEVEIISQYSIAILRIVEKFSYRKLQHHSSENNILVDVLCHEASTSRPLHFGLCVMVKIERFECIFIDERTHGNSVQGQEMSLDNSIPPKKLLTTDLKKAGSPKMDGKSACVTTKQLWAELSWGYGCELSLSSGLELADISIVKVENGQSKNKESANSPKAALLLINGREVTVLSQFCIELLSATLILPWYPLQRSPEVGSQSQSTGNKTVAKLEIVNVYLTDGMPRGMINRALSRVSATTNLLINIILSYECGTFTVSSKGGLVVVNTEALSLLFKTMQLLLSFLSILRSYDVQHICPSNLKERFFEEKPCFEESSSWIPGKVQNQQQKVQQDEDLNITPVKAYMDEQVFFNEFPWLTGGLSIEISKMCLLLIQTNVTSTAKDIRGLIFDVDAMLKLWDDLGDRFVDFQSTQFSICSVDVSAETSIDKDQRKNVPKFELNDVAVGMGPLKELGESSTSALDDNVESLQNIPSELESIDEKPESEKKANYILDNLRISSRIQRKSSGWSMRDDGWKGYCSFVGIDIGITTTELELIFALMMPLSTLSTQPRNNAQSSLNYVQPTSQQMSSIRYELPDGSIVAVKDVHEHLYLAVEKTDNTYRLTGVLHYTLVGEQALFKVRHSNQQVNSYPSWFSLLSLGAKNADGECFRVHYNPGTGLADVSSIHDRSWELWQTLPHKNSARTDEVDIDQYDAHYEHWVHLINKKSKQGLSLANGSPVMVKRPGSLFKFKILGSPTKLIDGEKISSFKENSEVLEIVEPTIKVSAPKVEIHIGMAAITLLHETGHGKHIRPLLRGRLENTKSVIQVLPFKTRVMGECKLIFEYFEAHVNRWSMLIQPINTEIFYRMRMTIDEKYQGSKTSSYLFVRLDQIDATIDDYSLDMILFIVGELNLAGPYTLKHSPILASRCMVENHTGLQLCCSFLEKHMKGTMRIPGGKTDTFLIRNMTSRRDLSSTQVLSSVSLQLEDSEDGISLPVDISLRDERTTALRTRVGSKKGTRRSPGPIIVVDVSNESQNGIVVTVSPMVRVYNASGIMLQLRCRRANNDTEGVVVILEDGNAIDDSMGAFNALNMDGEKRKTLSSFNLGNYLLSVRPGSSSVPGFCHTSADEDSKGIMFDWSEDIKGTKPFRISGFLEKLKYGLAKSIKGRSSQHSFGTVVCNTRVDKSLDGNAKSSHALHLFIQITRRFVPLSSIKDNDKDLAGGSGAILQEQMELVLLPTIRVYNLLESNIIVTLCSGLEGTAPQNSVYIERGGKVFMYADLAEPSFSVEIQDLMLKSDSLNIGDWRNSVKSVDPTHTDGFKEVEMDISFKDNQHCAKLKLSRGDDGVLQMLVYTQYALRNMSSNPLMYCAARNSGSLWSNLYFWSRKKSVQWPEDENGNVINPGMTVSLLQRSSIWLLRTVGRLSEISILDPESFSGTTELSIDVPHESGIIEQLLLGVMLDLSSAREMYPTCTIHISSRYVVLNESRDPIFVCQDGFQEDESAASLLESRDRVSLTKRLFQGQKPVSSSGYSAYVGPDMIDPSNFSVRFSLQENQLDWSGPVCVNALGSFSLRICKNTETVKVLKSSATVQQSDKFQFVSVDIEDERPSLVIRFRMQSQFTVPYRIENALSGLPIFFYQKGVGDCVTSIGPGKFAGYAWDDLTQPHKLVVFIPNAQIYNDIDLDKLSPWKSFQPTRQKGGFRLPMSLQSQLETMGQYNSDGLNSEKILDSKNIGYEIYADGRQRVLRVCEDLKSSKLIQIQSHVSSPSSKVNLVVHNLGITLLEAKKQMAEVSDGGSSDNLDKWSPFISMRMRRILVEFSNTHKHALFQLKVQNLSVDEKWKGAPFAAMVRVHNADRFDISETVLHMAVIVSNQVSSPIYVKYSSILLQAIDLNIDEDTLMKLVPFYRYSLAESSSSRQIYFEHFEINPIKIVGSFLPGQPLGDYTSAQETLRALLHSLIKVPTIKGFTVQLNGVLLSHALLTFRQLAIKCVQHYSWYALRAVYIAKGSKLLPPAFTSLFDDSAASSLDVFFDPSNGSVDLQGLTLGMFNLLSEGLNRRGFSGTSRYIGDLERMMKTAGSNILFAILTEVSDNVLKGAETGGIDGMVNGFRRGILNISMEPSFLRSAAVKGGLNRRIKLTRNAGVDEPYIEGYLQAMLDTRFKQDYLRVKVVDDEVLLKNLPPNSMLVEEILGCVKGFLGQEGFLVGETSARPMQSLRRLQEENEFKKLVPAAVALGEQLFVIFAVRALKNEARTWFKWGATTEGDNIAAKNEHQESKESSAEVEKASGTATSEEGQKTRRSASNVLLSFVLSSAMAYIDGRLCRHIPNTLARRVVSGFLLSFVE